MYALGVRDTLLVMLSMEIACIKERSTNVEFAIQSPSPHRSQVDVSISVVILPQVRSCFVAETLSLPSLVPVPAIMPKLVRDTRPVMPKLLQVFWVSTARNKAKHTKEENDEDAEVERRRMKMEEVQQAKSRQQEEAAGVAGAIAAAARVAATEAFFKVIRESEERKNSHKRWCRDRSRSRQKKHGLPTPDQLREWSSRPLVVL